MNRAFPALAAALTTFAFVAASSAAPIPGTYTTTDLGGQLLTGRASTWRPGINSGLPHVLHGQSWNGSVLGTQWEMRCPTENVNFTVVDGRDGNGTGPVTYTSTFNGGQFELYNTGGPWGFGVANLGVTTVVSTVQFVTNNPVASVVNAQTSGSFGGGCTLTFALANGFGVGETTSLNPAIVKPADYPTFLDASCGPAPANAQFGTWGTVITGTMRIDCVVPTSTETWGGVKSIYR
jgi:hypothetical protein